jgi:hypothetical protein
MISELRLLPSGLLGRDSQPKRKSFVVSPYGAIELLFSTYPPSDAAKPEPVQALLTSLMRP